MIDQKKGYINSFNTAGTVDGPGVRFIVFMQGCPLRCIYCHNPETWEFKGGQEFTPSEILQKYKRNASFYKNGGITISGGEPLAQSDFLLELVKLFKQNGIHIAIDTSGVILNEQIKEILSYVDLVLLDVKFTTDELYKKYVGCSITPVLDFVDYLSSTNIEVVVRQVITLGYNDTAEDIFRTKEIISPLKNLSKLELLPFKTLCLEKYENLNIPFPLKDTAQTPLSVIDNLNTYI